MYRRNYAIRTLFGLTVLDYSADWEQFKEFLQLGVDENGKPITESWIIEFDFRANAKKPLSELFREVREKEIILFIHPLTKRIWRFAYSVKIILRNPDTGLELVETGHYYYYGYTLTPMKKTPFKPLDKTSSYSETVILGEKWRKTVIRCLVQETDLKRVDLIRRKGYSRIIPVLEVTGKMRRERPRPHESSAYPGIISYTGIRAWCYIFTRKYDELHPPPKKIDNTKWAAYEWKPSVSVLKTNAPPQNNT